MVREDASLLDKAPISILPPGRKSLRPLGSLCNFADMVLLPTRHTWRTIGALSHSFRVTRQATMVLWVPGQGDCLLARKYIS